MDIQSSAVSFHLVCSVRTVPISPSLFSDCRPSRPENVLLLARLFFLYPHPFDNFAALRSEYDHPADAYTRRCAGFLCAFYWYVFFRRSAVPDIRPSPDMTLPFVLVSACACSYRSHAVFFPILEFGDSAFSCFLTVV